MGRKEKEEDREKESHESRKRRHKNRSRSRSRSRSRDRDVSKTKKIKQERDVDRSREDKNKKRDVKEKEKIKFKEERDTGREWEDRERKELDAGRGQRSSSPVVAGTGNESSLSIEETNKLRVQLGLKPLDVGADTESTETKTEKKDVHVPAENIREKKKTEEIKRKIEERREKRKLEQRLAHVRPLSEIDREEEDDALNWVERSRRLQKEKEEAEKRAKMLEELDKEFGVGDVVDSEFVKQKSQIYSAKNLKGIRVEHDEEAIVEGKELVLTLKDQDILKDSEDVLVNVNLLDDERYKKNNEIKKQKPGYQPYEDEAIDENGLPKEKSLLAKYDVEIDGEKKKTFVIGSDTDDEAAKKAKAYEQLQIKLKLQQKRIESLESRPLQIASEYYTEQEMVSFKKVKRKVRKVRPRSEQVLRADDLLQGMTEQETKSDLGSRTKKENKPEIINEVDDLPAPDGDLSNVKLVVEDSHSEVDRALKKAKKIQERDRQNWSLEMIARSIKQEPMEQSEDAVKSSIVLNATAEFCRTLGEIPTYGMAGNRDEDEDELMDFERQLAEERRRTLEKEERRREVERLQERGGWNMLNGEQEQNSDDSMDVDQQDKGGNATVILDEEPDVGSGMAAALKLAMSKGYLEKEEKKRISVSKAAQQLQALHYTIEDKIVEDDKYTRRRYDGPVSEFKEKEGYKPDIKLEYIDDSGKMLSTKEAFRHLSHKFHGKGSGKTKSEKRAKKQEDKMLMNRMSSTDTPLHTLKKLQEKQKELQSPYVVLSGKLTSTSIVKPGKGKK